MTYNIAIVGIDGAGKTTVANNLGQIFCINYTVGFVSKQSYFMNEGLMNNLTYLKKFDEILDSARDISDKTKSNVCAMVIGSLRSPMQTIMKKKLKKEFSPKVIISDWDAVIDTSAYAYMCLDIMKSIPVGIRNIMSKAYALSGYSDAYIYLDVTPEIAEQRIINREISEGKKIRSHENTSKLKILKEGFEQTLDYVTNKKLSQVYSINANKPLEDVIEDVSNVASTFVLKQ